MISLEELAEVLNGTFIPTTGDAIRAPGSTRVNGEGHIETIVESASSTRPHCRHYERRVGVADPPLSKSDEAGDGQDLERPLRKTDQKRSEDVSRDLKIENRRSAQAYRLQYQRPKDDHNTIRLENDRLMKKLDKCENDNMVQQQYVDRYNFIVRHLLLPFAQDRQLQFDDRTADTLNFVLSPLIQDAREAETLRDRVQTLQKQLLAREKMTRAISDDKLAKDFCKLAAQIKSLSRLLLPYDELDVVEALGCCIMASEVAPHHWNSRVGRKLFIEAWIWSVFMQMVFQNPFTIFGLEGRTVANLWSSMFGSEHCHGWPTPSPACETWRHKTMEQLVATVDEDIIMQGKTKDNYLYLEQHVVNARASVITTLEAGLASITSRVDCSQVLQIVDGAFTLLMHMSVQLPRFQISFPRSGDSFNKAEMKLLAILDEEHGTAHGTIGAIVNPGLMKWGDVQGKNHDHHYAIVPALVQLQASGDANI